MTYCKSNSQVKGKVYGVDFSDEMVIAATKRVKKDIDDGKVELINGDVTDLSCFASNTFDRVFHCNCYYFWPDMDTITSELHRVEKLNSRTNKALEGPRPFSIW
ncbi:hypothetical protein KP79_PYT07790 [Mizuhopecten yessoensis]|uniref:Methyltransferase type 11 domain-containing protein n=1 Tax=Mizuhopecten yessoensis TaxID=6573 RepID=A0A210Q8G6_MIZYE|nr:hypothetical protein KP79_PYT07790 [Mizuhopecten yessoensis]